MPRYPVIATWPFVVNLGLLVFNDAWLKAACPGWVTGKLSDVAGLAVVTLLLLRVGALPRSWRWRPRLRQGAVYAGVAVGFCWWKSPWSTPAIAAANAVLPFAVGRVVDYSDVLALAVLPLCGPVAARPAAFALPRLGALAARRWARVPLVGLTAFALVATSKIPDAYQEYRIRRAGPGALDRQAVARTVAEVAAQQQLACDDCARPTVQGRFTNADREVELAYSFPSPGAVAFVVRFEDRGTFLWWSPPSNRVKADRLRDALRARLSALGNDLEYAEPLSRQGADESAG